MPLPGPDTNGSIRVPSTLCGIFGIKPTYGRLSRAGSFPFVPSLDHVGPFARSMRDLAPAYDALLGLDADDPACARRQPIRSRGCWSRRRRFAHCGRRRPLHVPQRRAARRDRSRGEGARRHRHLELPEAARGRAAAFISPRAKAPVASPSDAHASEDFDPALRDRLLAGALMPAWVVVKAQKFRRCSATRCANCSRRLTPILAPATPCAATVIGQETLEADDAEVPLRANLGLYTQPITFIGLPVVAVPVPLEPLPIGIQIIAAPWREDVALRIAHTLETKGVVAAPRPTF